jgi:hypothetical protein
MKQKWGFNMTDLSDFNNVWKKFCSNSENYGQIMDLRDDYEDCIAEWKVKDLCLYFYLVGIEDGLNYSVRVWTEKVDRKNDSI